jgi:hypothetical protein
VPLVVFSLVLLDFTLTTKRPTLPGVQGDRALPAQAAGKAGTKAKAPDKRLLVPRFIFDIMMS